jgi:hypothetical protein
METTEQACNVSNKGGCKWIKKPKPTQKPDKPSQLTTSTAVVTSAAAVAPFEKNNDLVNTILIILVSVGFVLILVSFVLLYLRGK